MQAPKADIFATGFKRCRLETPKACHFATFGLQVQQRHKNNLLQYPSASRTFASSGATATLAAQAARIKRANFVPALHTRKDPRDKTQAALCHAATPRATASSPKPSPLSPWSSRSPWLLSSSSQKAPEGQANPALLVAAGLLVCWFSIGPAQTLRSCCPLEVLRAVRVLEGAGWRPQYSVQTVLRTAYRVLTAKERNHRVGYLRSEPL